jgi:putative inorganic carbon (HCO3(-)) transporter
MRERKNAIGILSYCKSKLQNFIQFLKEDWFRTVFFLSLTFLLPEYLAIGSVFLSLIFLIKTVKKEHLTVKIGALGILLCIYIATAFVSCIYALKPLHSLLMSMLWLAMMICYFAFTTILTTKSRLRITMQTFTVVACICGIISIIQYVLNLLGDCHSILNIWHPLDEVLYNTFSPEKFILDWEGNRTASTFSNPNLYAMEMLILLPLGLYCLLTTSNKNARILHSILLIIAFIGMLFTFSRGAYLSLLLMLFAFGVLNFSKSKLSRWILLIVCLGTALAILIPNPFTERLSTINIGDISISKRFDAWRAAVHGFKERPLGGYGIGSLNAWELLRNSGVDGIHHIHNIVLEILVEGGLIAVIIYTVMTWFVFIPNVLLHRSKDSDSSMLGATFLTIASGFMLFSMTQFPMTTPKGIMVFIMIFAISDATNRLCKINKTKNSSK